MSEMRPSSLDPHRNCPLGNEDCRQFAPEPVIELNHGGDEISVWRCESCGHGVTRPAMPDVSALYAARDSQDFQQQDGKIASWIKQVSFNRQALKALRDTQFTGGHIIDFGCGSGVLTEAFARNVPEGSQVTAMDFHEEGPPLLEQAAYRSLANAGDLQEAADMVTCFHVLEHDDDCHAFLEQILSYLKPGGTLLIEVPHVDCVWSDLFGKDWDNWYLPFHRVHFSRRSLLGLFERADLEVLQQQDVSIPSIGRSLARRLHVQNSLPFVLVSAVAFPIQWAVEKITKRPSALRVIARKRA